MGFAKQKRSQSIANETKAVTSRDPTEKKKRKWTTRPSRPSSSSRPSEKKGNGESSHGKTAAAAAAADSAAAAADSIMDSHARTSHATFQKSSSSSSSRKRHRSDDDRDSRDTKTARSSRAHSSLHNPMAREAPITTESLNLSQQLKLLSQQKQLQQALRVFWENRTHVDQYHVCMVIDCCARCGGAVEDAERVVQDFVQANHLSDRTALSVETQTALLNVYAQAGYISMAMKLFRSMMIMTSSTRTTTTTTTAAVTTTTTAKKMKTAQERQQQQQQQQRRQLPVVTAAVRGIPNVRTLNTVLRGCLRTAATAATTVIVTSPADDPDGRNIIEGGVLSSEEAWEMYCSRFVAKNTGDSEDKKRRQQQQQHPKQNRRPSQGAGKEEEVLDPSAYEYTILLLCQALQTDKATQRITEYQARYSISCKGKASIQGGKDPAQLETLAIVYYALARAYAMRGRMDDPNLWTACQRALSSIQLARTQYDQQQQQQQQQQLQQEDGAQSGGIDPKRAGKRCGGGKRAWKDSVDPARMLSNQVYRSHRLSELENNIRQLLKLRSTVGMSHLTPLAIADRLLRRVLYFSDTETGSSVLNQSKAKRQPSGRAKGSGPVMALWYSYGLSQLVMGDNADIRSADSAKAMERLVAAKQVQTLDKGGRLDLDYIFPKRKNPLDIEVGSGHGDWIVHQAETNRDRNHIAVELRADRVGHILSKITLRPPAAALDNLCVVGDDCYRFLTTRIASKSVSTIFVNYPEPPSQSYGGNPKYLQAIVRNDEEPAHMLRSSTLLAMAGALAPRGRIVMVTDNRKYAELLAVTWVRVLQSGGGSSWLRSARRHDLRGSKLEQIESFGPADGTRLELFAGDPNEAIGHSTVEGGASYFDRLWRSADKQTQRFVIVVYRCN